MSTSRGWAVLFVVLLMGVCGCDGSAAGTLPTGRIVVARSNSLSLSSSFSQDTATIQAGGKTIVVKPTSLLVEGVTFAVIDQSVSKVEVTVKGGEVTFVADGKPVNRPMR
ncbi:MAG: hypothetical protein U0795_24940 [Pirellulales bacterium]